MGVLGIFNTSVTVREGSGNITIYVGFMSPPQVSSDISVTVAFSTADGSAEGKMNLFSY